MYHGDAGAGQDPLGADAAELTAQGKKVLYNRVQVSLQLPIYHNMSAIVIPSAQTSRVL